MKDIHIDPTVGRNNLDQIMSDSVEAILLPLIQNEMNTNKHIN